MPTTRRWNCRDRAARPTASRGQTTAPKPQGRAPRANRHDRTTLPDARREQIAVTESQCQPRAEETAPTESQGQPRAEETTATEPHRQPRAEPNRRARAAMPTARRENHRAKAARPRAESKPPRQSRVANRDAPRKPPQKSRKANRTLRKPPRQSRKTAHKPRTNLRAPISHSEFRIPPAVPPRTNAPAGAKTGQTQTFRRPASRQPIKRRKTRRAGAALRMEAPVRMGALPRGRQFAIRLFEQKPSRETEHSDPRDDFFDFFTAHSPTRTHIAARCPAAQRRGISRAYSACSSFCRCCRAPRPACRTRRP